MVCKLFIYYLVIYMISFLSVVIDEVFEAHVGVCFVFLSNVVLLGSFLYVFLVELGNLVGF